MREYKYTDEFEQAFGDFLERDECEAASEALFASMRAAFAAGWDAAVENGFSKPIRLVPGQEPERRKLK